jgi:hypothetical protein
MKTFPLRTVLTVTTGRLLTKGKPAGDFGHRDNGIGDLYDILGHMTKDSPMTHQLGRFAEECKPWLLRWFPELESAGSDENMGRLDTLLADCKARGEDTENAIAMWVKWMSEPGVCNLKASYDVPTIPADDHTRKDGYDELVEMRGTDEGIVLIGR